MVVRAVVVVVDPDQPETSVLDDSPTERADGLSPTDELTVIPAYDSLQVPLSGWVTDTDARYRVGYDEDAVSVTCRTVRATPVADGVKVRVAVRDAPRGATSAALSANDVPGVDDVTRGTSVNVLGVDDVTYDGFGHWPPMNRMVFQ
jgi:hypothetical protein